jgi:RNA polymerase sigma factor (sigma-70 family)
VAAARIGRMTDVELVHCAEAGDREATEALYGKYSKFMERAAASLCHPHESFAGDAAQTVWLALLAGQWRLRGESSEPTLHRFIFSMIRYVVLWMREASQAVRLQPIGDGIALRLVAIHHDPVDSLIDAEQAARLRWAVAALPQRDQALLRLRYGAALTVRAIAARDGRSMQTVAEHLTRIHRRLAEQCDVLYLPVRRGRYARDIAGVSQYGQGSPRARARRRGGNKYLVGAQPTHVRET